MFHILSYSVLDVIFSNILLACCAVVEFLQRSPYYASYYIDMHPVLVDPDLQSSWCNPITRSL
jgi:hypothetical protein